MWYGVDAAPPGGREALAVAPMLDWTDRHYRYLARLLTRRTTLYTEMIWDAAIAHNADDLDHFLGYDDVEHPVVVQLGGGTPELMAYAAAICRHQYGYDEVAAASTR